MAAPEGSGLKLAILYEKFLFAEVGCCSKWQVEANKLSFNAGDLGGIPESPEA